MSRWSKDNLPPGLPQFNVATATAHLESSQRFESKAFCRNEDRLRARKVKASAELVDKVHRIELVRLAEKLENADLDDEQTRTPASSLWCGHYRFRFAGTLWKLYDEAPQHAKPSTFTVVPRNWRKKVKDLHAMQPQRLLSSFRSLLYRYGAAKAGGWMVIALHGEHEPVSGKFQLHIHGLASPEMLKVLDNLRTLPSYSFRDDTDKEELQHVYRPIRVTRKPLTNLPEPLTYIFQGFWPSRPTLLFDEDNLRRARRKQRIAEPEHSMALAWLDRWRFGDLVLMIGLRVGPDGLVRTSIS